MKNVLIVFLLLGLLLGVFACKGKANTPEAVAGAFLSALEKRDFETAGKLITRESETLFDLWRSFITSMDEESMGHYEHKISGFELAGDTAIVSYEIWTSSNTQEKEEQKLTLKKVDGKWKVNLEKAYIEK